MHARPSLCSYRSSTHTYIRTCCTYVCKYSMMYIPMYFDHVQYSTLLRAADTSFPFPSLPFSHTCRYPHLACEILTSETKDSFTILEQLCGEDRYQNMLWAFLDEKEPLNPLIGSFISKVLSVLLAHKCNSVSCCVWCQFPIGCV